MYIGIVTQRRLVNIVIVCLLFAILYWDSRGMDDPDGFQSIDSRVDPDLTFSENLDMSGSLALKAEPTTLVPEDHTSGESDRLGVFKFFQDLWIGDDWKARLDRKLHPERQQQQQLKAFSLRVTNEQINTFHVDLPPLLPNYKNPCWIEEIPVNFTYDKSYYSECVISRRRQVSKHAYKFRAFEAYLHNRSRPGERWRIRCFPYFFLLGVGKSGTTDFFDTMKDYVSDFVPGFLKELHFWEWKRCHERELCRSIDPRRPVFADYLDTYDAAAEVIRRTSIKRNDGTSYHPLIIGDFTPSTLTFHPCWDRLPGNEHLDEPRFTTAHYIYSIRPQAKFIILLRDPVERVYSNYRMHRRLTKNPLHDPEIFHKEISEVLRDLEKCFRENTHRACAYRDMKFNLRTHVTNSLYEIFIHDWLLLFPRDQFLIIKMEDYSADRVLFVKKTIEFLGLTPLTPEQQWRVENKEITNTDSRKVDMLRETRTLLRRFFRPWNQRLARLLNDDRFTWNY